MNKKNPMNPTSPTPTLCPSQAKDDAINAALIVLIQHMEKVNPDAAAKVDFGSILDSPIATETAADALDDLRASVAACFDAYQTAVESAAERQRDWEIECAAENLAAAIAENPFLTDAETFEEAFALAAKKVREKLSHDRDFCYLVGGTISDFGKDIAGIEGNRPNDA
jgi:hypothetical protein